MDCANALECLSQRLDENLAPEVEQSLRAHLDSCEQCRAAAADLSMVHQRLRATVPEQAVANRVATNAVRSVETTSRARHPGETRRRTAVVLAAAAALAACIYAVLWLPGGRRGGTAARPANQVEFTLALGNVDVRPPASNDWRTISLPTDAWQEIGCQVRTAASSQCELVCPTGGVVRVDEQTELTLSKPSELAVARGRVWCEAPASEALTVVAALTSLPSKSLPIFTCSTSSTMQTTVSNTESIEVLAASGPVHIVAGNSPVVLAAGHRIKASGEGLEPPEPLDSRQQTSWMLPLLALKGGADREFSAGVTSVLARVGGSKLDYVREEELVRLGGPGAVPLIAYLKTSSGPADNRKRLVAARVIRETAGQDVIPDLIDLLENSEPETRIAAAGALERLTGLNHGVPPEEWTQWGSRQQAAVAQWRAWRKS